MNKNQKDGNFEENLGSRVKKLRQEMNLTQAEVADALHVTPGYISNVENNRTAMSLRILIYYAKLMNTTLDSLVGSLEPAYKENALDNEVMHLVAQMNDLEKQKLINTLRIWIIDFIRCQQSVFLSRRLTWHLFYCNKINNI